MRPPRAAILLSLYAVVAALLSLIVLVPQARLYRDHHATADVVAQLRFLRAEWDSGAAHDMQGLFPEGYVFSHVLYGLTWIDVAHGDPARTDEALDQARWALDNLESEAGRVIFSPRLRPAYGVFYTGWVTRLRGAVVELAGPGAPELDRFTAECAALAAAFETDGPFLSAYAGQAWPVDSVVAVAALRLHDRVVGARFGEVVSDWLAAARGRLDAETGLLPHRVTPVREGARGSSQSIIQRFLPEIDARWAGEQYARFRELFLDAPLGLPGVREYPRGVDGAGDVDSGPLLLGISASATVVTLGAARVHGDTALAEDLTGLGEGLGVPITLGGATRYAFGALPIGDAFLAWSFAAPAAAPTAFPGVAPWWWRLPWHAAAIGLLVLLWFPMFRAFRRGGDRSSPLDRFRRSPAAR